MLDKSLNSYSLYIFLSGNSCINILANFLDNGIFEIDDKSNEFLDLFHIASELKIDAILNYYHKNVQVSNELSLKNVIDFYEKAISSGDKKKQKNCIDFIAKNFQKLDQSALKILMLHHGFDFCERILTNELLQVNSEDDICSFIVSLCQKNHNFTDLLHYIHLEFCKPETKDMVYNFGRDNNLQSVLYEVFYKTIRNRERKPLEISEQFYQNIDTITTLPDINMKSSSAQLGNLSMINKPNSDFVTFDEEKS
ncbi:hypothetical protein TVAG_100660 [Trichomonas vaginalis G3]|uniref:Uncharacterized protein n=1 Tax=Trichomonas vaginalis (strain ATCC PRA-98 / G3) TaxID=412133 RepID=A2ENP3_TRIV3|nr:proteasome regulatory particle assembly [Trichomonas vaginalis G3]EAY05743.1 hypothetical protein TVAG_100660 [Trichomonas vaginalis G3]KAI5535144.1 proteasome regulatory particle assembly [Trichomonas vaginalis G3]|eukprot:XP_001317966.1 hypothetical protein [Trichomonas vaginalis G3]